MGRTQTALGKALRVALIMLGVGVAGYFALMVLVFYSMQEPGPHTLNVHNASGRPVLIEREDTQRLPGPAGYSYSVVVWRNNASWPAGGDQCEQNRLVARDLQGTVVSRRVGDCKSDTWTISGQGLSAAPRYQREPVPPDHVEVRLEVVPDQPADPVVAWWRVLPQTLGRAEAAGRQAGVNVYGPFLEGQELTMYLRGPDAATVLKFARTHVLRPSPGRAYAYVGPSGQPVSEKATPVPLGDTTRPTIARTS